MYRLFGRKFIRIRQSESNNFVDNYVINDTSVNVDEHTLGGG